MCQESFGPFDTGLQLLIIVCFSWDSTAQFQRDEATKLGILSLVDDSHPATAELLDDSVM